MMTPDATPSRAPHEHVYADGDALAVALAAAVADQLRAALVSDVQATIALSGGTTPKRFLAALSREALDWSRVRVVPVDERWVPPTHERANARLLREHLLQGDAASATLVPLFVDGETPDEARASLDARVRALPRPFAAVVLGMGTDGHTASWFPDGDPLAAATDPAGDAFVLPMRAPGAPEPRITLTLPAVLDTRALYLHVEGDEKRRVLARAVAGDDLPIAAVLRQRRIDPELYWCP